MSAWTFFTGLFGRRTLATAPAVALVPDTAALSPDSALQIGAVWACVERIAKTVATLPLFVYTNRGGKRDLDRGSQLWLLLHETPNARMTPVEFWIAMLMNFSLRGNAYARIDRDQRGEAIALWPMPTDQVEPQLLDDGTPVYQYRVGANLAILAAENVLHLKEMGNGIVGLSRLDYMRAATTEATNAQTQASRLFSAAGKPTGVLMVDSVLNPNQRERLKNNFGEMATGSMARLYVLEASMKYQQLSMSPEDQQLLETRQFGIEEIGRWFGVPAVLINHSNVTAWGSGIEQIVEGFYKLTIRPLLVTIEQALTKRVLTTAQRATLTVEFGFDALLRSNLKDRAEIYSKLVQNGIKTRNECRQLENDPPLPGGDELTAQTNLTPLAMLGKVQAPAAPAADPQDDIKASYRHSETLAAIAASKGEPVSVTVAPVINTPPTTNNFSLPATQQTIEIPVTLNSEPSVVNVPAPEVTVIQAQPKATRTVIEQRDADGLIIATRTEEI